MKRSLVALAALGLLVSGCAAGPSVLTTLPEAMPESMGGLPADAPAEPKNPYQYPAVHDVPAPRADTPLNDDQLSRVQTDLLSTRDHQIDRAAKEQAQDDADFADTPDGAAPSKPAAAKPAKARSAAAAKRKAAVKKPRAPAPQAGTATNP